MFAAGTFLTVASPAGGWAYAALCFLPGLVGAAFLFGMTRWRDVLAVAAVPSLLCGLLMYQSAPPDHGRIRNQAERAGVPVAGWELLATDDSGNTWCFKGCPEVLYFYAASGSPAETVATLGAVLEAQGWVGGARHPSYGGDPSEYDPLARGTWSKGRWRAELRVPSAAARFGWSATAQAQGRTPVEVTFRAGQ